MPRHVPRRSGALPSLERASALNARQQNGRKIAKKQNDFFEKNDAGQARKRGAAGKTRRRLVVEGCLVIDMEQTR